MNLMKHGEPILYKKNVRKDRQPKDTSKAVHGVFDEYFEKHFGLKMRSESIFTTSDISTASEYGQPYMVIPIGDYSYCWSPKVEDLTSYYDREINVRVKKMYDVGEIQEYDAEMLVKINSILPASVWNIDKVGFDYKKLIFDILDDAKYKDTGLKNAISSNHELMIACDSYYVLNNINRRNIALIYEVLDML